MSGDPGQTSVADDDPVCQIDPQPLIGSGIKRFDSITGDLAHERTVRNAVPLSNRIPVVVGQQTLVAAADPQRTILLERNGIDVLPLGEFCQAAANRKICPMSMSYRVAAVARSDPDVPLHIAETAPKIARIAEFEPVDDVVFGISVRRIERVDIVAPGSNIDRSGPV